MKDPNKLADIEELISKTKADLRDQFAMKAMQAYLTKDTGCEYHDEKIAQWAYQAADAMMKARE